MEFVSLILFAGFLGVVILGVVLFMLLKKGKGGNSDLQKSISDLSSSLTKIEATLREDFRINREESSRLARESRTEVTDTLSKSAKEQSEKLESMISKIEEKNKEMREEIRQSFRVFAENFDKNVKSFNDLQREKFAQLEERQNKMVDSTEKRLDQMRETVDEKLQKTLNERLGQSFELVGKQLESVQKGLGEMQSIASDVGGLKKVLSNVKLRGNVGEVQLAMILEQILAPSQYETNVKTKQGSSDPVEFAIKLPGRSEDDSAVVYLPIDAKFPKEVYEHLLNAYETALPEDIETATKNLEATIKKNAKDIRDKYIDPPHTTDFAIMFLPYEGIYAEVIRRSTLVDQLRDEFKITVAGPTTLVAILNSLQMGFRTLALQKRSSEVWRVLGAVKTEFEKFGGMLEKAQKNLHSASDTVDELLGKRNRAIIRKLKDVEALPASEAQELLPDMGQDDPGEGEEA
jgi:DNA recombination protein RmuC